MKHTIHKSKPNFKISQKNQEFEEEIDKKDKRKTPRDFIQRKKIKKGKGNELFTSNETIIQLMRVKHTSSKKNSRRNGDSIYKYI